MTVEREIIALSEMTAAGLRAKWREVFRKAAPALTPEMLGRAIAYRVQERCHGGLPSSTRREIASLARKAERIGAFGSPPEISLKSGTRLIREWHGRTIKVTVGDAGFEYDGRQYGSLSQISREVTGTAWSGPRFFGLRSRKNPPAQSSRDGR